MPGTFGALIGLPIGLACAPLWNDHPASFVSLFVLAFWGACRIAGEAEKQSSRHDDSRIVIDEVFGMVAARSWLPRGWTWLAAFGLFRVFDVMKPWPASYFDKWKGGAGVMLDDLAAGIYANVAAHIVWRLVNGL
jgi:phosphatidylglycerophosphatase A